jgi:hypothetical protein
MPMKEFMELTPWKRRAFILLVAPLILPWAYVSTLAKGMVNAFWYARQEVRIELEQMRMAWREGDRGK